MEKDKKGSDQINSHRNEWMQMASGRMLREPSRKAALSRTNRIVRSEGVPDGGSRIFGISHSICPSLPTPSR